MSSVLNALIVLVAIVPSETAPATSQPAPTDARSLTIQLAPGESRTVPPPPRGFTARFTARELKSLLEADVPDLPLPLRLDDQRQAAIAALERISMAALVDGLEVFLLEKFPERRDPNHDLIAVPVPKEKQITIETPDLEERTYCGPQKEVVGFLVRDLSESDFVSLSVHIIQTARQMLESGNPAYDRGSPEYYTLLAKKEVEAKRQACRQAKAAAVEQAQIRKRIGEALGVYDPRTDTYTGQPDWLKESRRFSYIVHKDGRFIDRLQPLVDRINHEVNIAGFPPPSPLDKPGIHFDPDLADAEIVLPRGMMADFLKEADSLEQRMAEEHVISIEAVRLTDRDLIDGAVASRLRAQVQGVHNVERFNTEGVFRQLGFNTLLAVANQQLQIRTLQAVSAGAFPEGVAPVTIAAPELPSLRTERRATTIGSAFSVGADDIFFDGREQAYGFSYIGPDGIEHTLSLEVVDSLREFWQRIERNLIVHKIKKTEERNKFTVPVGPDTKTFEGIAALISQENQQLVVATGTGALSEISATAGTWLIIQDFQIGPIPGSSTALTEEEQQTIQDRVMLNMFLRAPLVPLDDKRSLLATQTPEDLRNRLEALYEEWKPKPIRSGRTARDYEAVYGQRLQEVTEEAAAEKKERNSVITLTFYSSQGNIIQQPGVTQLGDANDLTSFTTELRPNLVTPISSFVTKSGSGAKGSSPLTGVAKGEQKSEEKTMTHLAIRVRLPTVRRERKDRQEGRHLGYFELPITRRPHTTVDLPMLSSSEHPLERLSKLRVGLMFDALQGDRVRRTLDLINPNSLAGTVPVKIWETATTRLLMNRKIVSDSPGVDQTLVPEFRQRFILEVRSLVEFDYDFFEAPNLALRNMTQWNNPDRIVLALNNSPGKFALERLITLIDELGLQLVPDDYADDFLARSPLNYFGRHKVHPLSAEELRTLRRDVANHYLRCQEAYGDAFLEAVSMILGLGTYRAASHDQLLAGPFRGYHDLVVFDYGGRTMASPELFEEVHAEFRTLKSGGYRGGLLEPSLECIEDMHDAYREFVIRGRDVLKCTRP